MWSASTCVFVSARVPSLRTTSSAIASLSSRLAWAAMIRRACDSVSASRSSNRSDLHVNRAVDDENAVHRMAHRRFDEQWYDNQLVLAACGVSLAHRLIADCRMQDGFELTTGFVVGENFPSHGSSIESAVGADHLISKLLPDRFQCGLARFDDLSRNDVGIDDRGAEIGKHVCNRGLAAGNPAGQANAKRISGVAAHLEGQVERTLDPVAPEHR